MASVQTWVAQGNWSVVAWVAQDVEVKSGYSLAQLVEERPEHLLMVYHLEVESRNLQDC